MAQVLARLIHHDNLVHLFSSMPVPGCLVDDELDGGGDGMGWIVWQT